VTAARLAATVLQVLLVFAVAPLLVGLMRKVRCRLEGRTGPPVTQPWRDLRKLAGKQRIRPVTSSWVFATAPLVLVATAGLVAGIVPFLTTRTAFDQVGDLFAVVYLLLLGSVFLALAGLDAGTAFGGMGSSREMTIVALAEPALLLGIFALATRGGSSNLASIVTSTLADPQTVVSPQGLLAFGALAIVVVAETGRLPVDNPSTHLELTMVHEAMILEYAGPDLALVELAAQLRLTVFFGLLANLFLPWGIATTTRPVDLAVAAVAVAAKLVALAVIVAGGEVFVAKVRLFRVPELLAAAFVLAFLAATASFVLP
jgi:formate hydrogenlyase subunit 4